jgi:hypothetical protein
VRTKLDQLPPTCPFNRFRLPRLPPANPLPVQRQRDQLFAFVFAMLPLAKDRIRCDESGDGRLFQRGEVIKRSGLGSFAFAG